MQNKDEMQRQKFKNFVVYLKEQRKTIKASIARMAAVTPLKIVWNSKIVKKISMSRILRISENCNI